MHRHHTARRRRRAPIALASALLAGTVALTGSVTSAGTATETDVMAWVAATSTTVTVDTTNTCVSGSPESVAYRNDRVVVRTRTAPATIATQVDALLDTKYGLGNWVLNVEKITFRVPPGQSDAPPLLAVNLVAHVGGYDVVWTARAMRTVYGETSSPDYYQHASAPYSHYFPSGPPAPYPGPLVQRPDLALGAGVTVFVYDTGLAPTAPGELPNASLFEPADDERPNADKSGDPKLVDFPFAAHGKEIAGVLNAMAPAATVSEVRVNSRNGLLTDVDAARRIAQTFTRIPLVANLPDLLVMSFGTTVCDIAIGDPSAYLEPLGTQAIVEMVDRFDPVKPQGMLVVAAAGNMASTRPHYPAAFPSVLSVGALDGTKDADLSPWSSASKTAPVAEFSNTGTWVDAYAVGVDVPTNGVRGGLRYEYGGALINGPVTVDGTSFSTPLVAAHLAELMSVGGVTAREAEEQLLSTAIAPLPRCGASNAAGGVAIVLASFNGDIDDPATQPPQPC